MALTRRAFLDKVGKGGIFLAGTSAMGSLFQACTAATKGKKWNFVFILADDLGWNQVGYHGIQFYETPNIDRIAHEGVYFTDAYAASPVCSPTRASLMTGKYPARLGLTDFVPGYPYPYAKLTTPEWQKRLPMEEVTIPELLKSKGYVSGHFGKWHLSTDKNYRPGREYDPESQGFDEVLTTVKPTPDTDPDSDAHHAKQITERAIGFIETHKDRPFFCYVSHHVVHRPLMENEELIEKYRSKPDSNKPINNAEMGAMIERMDIGVGQILKKLDDLNLTDRTVVIFYSDNGGLESLQDQDPLRGGKAMIFEGGIRVPLAIRWPGVILPGSSSAEPVISNDFLPTIVEIVGIRSFPENIDGISLLPLLKTTGEQDREALYWHYPHYHHLGYKPSGAVRVGDYKLIEWYEESLLGEDNPVNLYNLRTDIGETIDLTGEMPEKAAELREMLHQWRRSVNADEMIVNSGYDPEKTDLRNAI